jgi:hypothetical protein
VLTAKYRMRDDVRVSEDAILRRASTTVKLPGEWESLSFVFLLLLALFRRRKLSRTEGRRVNACAAMTAMASLGEVISARRVLTTASIKGDQVWCVVSSGLL